MTEANTDRRERSLAWIEREFHFKDGTAMAEALRSGPRWKREMAISTLEDIACAERRRGLAGHWAYDLARHQHIVEIIKRERALLAVEDLRAARCQYQASGRKVRHQLHRRGWAPLSLLRRLGTAGGGLLAAIAGRCSKEDAS